MKETFRIVKKENKNLNCERQIAIG